MKIIANLLRNGNVIKHQNKMYQVMNTSTIKPGKGGAYIQVEMRDIVSGLKTNQRWRTSVNIEKLNTEEIDAIFLFVNQEKITIMRNDNYEQIEIDSSILGEKVKLLEDGMQLKVDIVDDTITNVHVPKTIEVKIEYADAVVKGQTASTSYKTASTDKGLTISVPPHIKQGDKIIIHSDNLEYIEKSKKIIMVFISPILNLVSRSIRKIGKRVVRDFNEIEKLQTSIKGTSFFAKQSLEKLKKNILFELNSIKPEYDIIYANDKVNKIDDNEKNYWIVNPLDGFINFCHGIPHFCISISVQENNEILASVIYDPIKDELYAVQKNKGSYLNDSKIYVSGRSQKSDSILSCSCLLNPKESSFNKFFDDFSEIRISGCSTLDFCYLGMGRCEVYLCLNQYYYSNVAGILFLTEAGGVEFKHKENIIIATNKQIQSNIENIINKK